MKTLLLFIAFILISLQVNAQMITVKQDGSGDFTVIQEAIEAAQEGDTVLVHEGIYYEHINFLGKKITVASLDLTNPQNPFHVINTVIDGSIPARADSNSVVHFVSGEDTTSVLHGFTIRNGCGTAYKGGGILVYNSGAKIVHNRIVDNQVLPSGYGGGIYASASSYQPQHLVVIENNTIANDSLYGSFQHYGAGMYINMNSRIKNNIIENNHIYCETMAGFGVGSGGGIFCDLYDYHADDSYDLELTGNTIKNNKVEAISARGGGVYVLRGLANITGNLISGNELLSQGVGSDIAAGGGMHLGMLHEGSLISENTIENNLAFCQTSISRGGGINIYSVYDSTIADQRVTIERNIFKNNEANYGGGIRLYSCNACILNNFFNGNYSMIEGGAIRYTGNVGSEDTVVRIINNTFTENNAQSGALNLKGSNKILLMNNIFYNPDTNYYEIRHIGEAALLQIHYNLLDTNKINGFWEGSHNMYDDPQLITGTYELLQSTPCLDQGAVKLNVFGCEIGCPTMDIEGMPRPQSGAPELGAFEIFFISIPESFDKTLPVSVSPNPVFEKTTISFTAEGPQENLIGLYDIAGNKVIERTYSSSGNSNCKVEINVARLSPGIYLVKVVTGKTTGTAKLMVIK